MAPSARTSSRVSKPVVREDEVDPTMVLLSGDEDDQGHGLTCLDDRDNDPEFDYPVQAMVDVMSEDEEEEEGDQSTSDDTW